MKWKKVALIGGGAIAVGGLAALAIFTNRTLKAGNNIEVVPTVKIHKIDWDGITLRLDTTLKNPSPKAFKMKFPFVRMVYNNSVVGSSQAQDQTISVPQFSEVVIQGLMFKLPMLKIFSTAGQLAKAIAAGEEVKVQIVTSSYVDPFWKYDPETRKWSRLFSLPGASKGLPYNSVEPFTISKGKQTELLT